MALEIQFKQSKAARFNDCLANNRPIRGVRSVDDLMTLAGACFYRLMLHQPSLREDRDWSSCPLEQKEAALDAMIKELLETIHYTGHLYMHVHGDGSSFERTFGSSFRFRAALEGDKVKFSPLNGK